MSKLPPQHPTQAETLAVKAVAAGTASPDQQARFFRFVVDRLSRLRESAFDPASDRMSAFMEGRRSVGVALSEIIEASSEMPQPRDTA